jgi:hypothetical protein
MVTLGLMESNNFTRLSTTRKEGIISFNFYFVILMGLVAKWQEGNSGRSGRSLLSHWEVMRNKKKESSLCKMG